MQQYHALLHKLLNKREKSKLRDNRTDTPTTSLFCEQMRFNLEEGFPLLTTKKVSFHNIMHELLWFLSGDTNIKYLLENDVHIWSDWPYESWKKNHPDSIRSMKWFEEQILEDHPSVAEYGFGVNGNTSFAKQWGDLGLVYGHQWRRFGEVSYMSYGERKVIKEGFDQIKWVEEEAAKNPTSRRLIVDSWNPNDVPRAALPPCHHQFQLYIEDGKLSLYFQMRKLNDCALVA